MIDGMIGSENAEISDAVLQYMERSQATHAFLKQVLTQASACTLAAMMKSGAPWRIEGAVELAREAMVRAADDVGSLNAPPEADRHHFHLRGAAQDIEAAIDELRAGANALDDDLRDRLTRRLKAATDHLRAASKVMPGHPMVDLSQACCAMHARQLVQQN